MLGEVVNLVDSVHPLGLRKNDDDSFTLFHVGANALEDLVKVDLSFDEFNGDPVQVGDLWYVRLQRSGVGNEIWVTDGTSEGTRRIPANVPGR